MEQLLFGCRMHWPKCCREHRRIIATVHFNSCSFHAPSLTYTIFFICRYTFLPKKKNKKKCAHKISAFCLLACFQPYSHRVNVRYGRSTFCNTTSIFRLIFQVLNKKMNLSTLKIGENPNFKWLHRPPYDTRFNCWTINSFEWFCNPFFIMSTDEYFPIANDLQESLHYEKKLNNSNRNGIKMSKTQRDAK